MAAAVRTAGLFFLKVSFSFASYYLRVDLQPVRAIVPIVPGLPEHS